ncbi:MAG: hypothetical protein V4662_23755 [Verrucomicrobiota bacterium]
MPGLQDGPLNMELALVAADREPLPDTTAFLKKLFTLTDYNQAVFPAPNAEKLQVNFIPALGFFTGKVKLPFTPPMQPKTVHFSGVVKQRYAYIDAATGEGYGPYGEGRGFYLADAVPGTVQGPKVSGTVFLYPTYY